MVKAKSYMALAAMLVLGAGVAVAQQPERLGGKPNLNGIWQAMNGAYWDLEPHEAREAPVASEELGAIGAIPAGLGVVEGGTIPYKPEALAQREKNLKGAPKIDPEAACYLPGIPRATYMNYPFQIVQGDGDDILIAYEYASAKRVIEMKPVEVPPIDTWMGTSYGSWEGDTLKVVTLAQNGMSWLDRAGNYLSPTATVTERFKPEGPNVIAYEATIEDPAVYTKPWKISMPLYRHVEKNAQLMEFRCVPFSEKLLYGDLLKTKGVSQGSGLGASHEGQ
jgi:hypothetical protein